MQNGIFKLDWASIGEAILTAAIGAVVAGLVTIVTTSGFDVLTANWALIGDQMLNWAVVAGVVSLGKDLLSTNSGSLLNITPPNAP